MHNGLTVSIYQQEPIGIDATLNCAPGEMLALIGPSGSGKSTLLRTIAGLHRAQRAHINCAAKTWDDSTTGLHLSTQRRKVGFVFQQYALFPHKSALENVMLATPASSKTERQQKAVAQLQRTNMHGLESRKPATLSGGQKQRVALARALAREPNALLLDEPFSAVDQATRRKLYRELAALRKTLDIPIVLVTHDLNEVQLLADSLCLIHKGKSLQQGPVADVVNQPSSREIARLLGHQNIFSAKITEQHGEHAYYQIGDVPAIQAQRLAGLKPGDKASLLIAPSAIVVQPKQNAKHNDVQLDGSVRESVVMGDELLITLHLEQVPKSLRFKVPVHLAQQYSIQDGSPMRVAVQAHGIHAMHA